MSHALGKTRRKGRHDNLVSSPLFDTMWSSPPTFEKSWVYPWIPPCVAKTESKQRPHHQAYKVYVLINRIFTVSYLVYFSFIISIHVRQISFLYPFFVVSFIIIIAITNIIIIIITIMITWCTNDSILSFETIFYIYFQKNMPSRGWHFLHIVTFTSCRTNFKTKDTCIKREIQ